VPDPPGVLYADTSALVKLAVEEPETRALRIELNRWDKVATSAVRRRLTTSQCERSPPHCSNSN
jgi:uncharacterized protein with PIN domain